jgi:LysR family hydrogen peroxide-inducible transcriptional activator
MTLTQLEYIVAVDTYRQFVTAAEHCHVTQPTLSMQIQKLEDELGLIIFDRSKQPVVPSEQGMEIITQARRILREADKLKDVAREKKEGLGGNLRIGIIPTLAPYLLPLFIKDFTKHYPKVVLTVEELSTEDIVKHLKNDMLDCGIMATPLEDPQIKETPLFYEPFVAYISPGHPLYKHKQLHPEQIDTDELLLLNETHCLRLQIVNFCQAKSKNAFNFRYKAGSVETLKKMVEIHQGITLLPALATLDLSKSQQAMVRHFAEPQPVREISIVTHRHYLKQSVIKAFASEITNHIPAHLQSVEEKNIISIKKN